MSALACIKCGVTVHPDTALWNAGLCMSCARQRPPGAAQRREAFAAKRLAESGPSSADTQDAQYQMALRRRVRDSTGGFSQLSGAERQYFLLLELRQQLGEGSIFCFFDNSPGNHYLEVLAHLEEVGLGGLAQGLSQAKQVLFGEDDVPEDVGTRRRAMPTDRHGEPRKDVRKALDVIDKKMHDAEDRIEEVLQEIRRANRLY